MLKAIRILETDLKSFKSLSNSFISLKYKKHTNFAYLIKFSR